MAMAETQWQEFIDEAAVYFDSVATPSGMQAECERLADCLEEIGYDDDYSAMCDFFAGISAWEDRVDSNGEFESQLVYLAWGNPWITFDSATGEVLGSFCGAVGEARISDIARRHFNNFFRSLYHC